LLLFVCLLFVGVVRYATRVSVVVAVAAAFSCKYSTHCCMIIGSWFGLETDWFWEELVTFVRIAAT
jgi:hypothetical protein